MSRKDYVLLAQAPREAAKFKAHSPGEQEGVLLAIKAISQALARDNARFQPDRFLYFIEYGNLQGYFSRRK